MVGRVGLARLRPFTWLAHLRALAHVGHFINSASLLFLFVVNHCVNLSLAARRDKVFFLLTLAAALADAYGDYNYYN